MVGLTIEVSIGHTCRKRDVIVDDLAEQGIVAGDRVATGRPTEEILTSIESGGFTLVAMATHRRGVLGRNILGSVTDAVIHKFRVPTIVVRANDSGEHENISAILVPLDGSSLAETVLPFVEELPASHLDVDDQIEHEAVAYLQDVAAWLTAKDLTVTWHVYHGAPIHPIDRVAKDTPNTLVALTTHGRSGIKRLVLGSVADAVICDSGHPVLIVPPRADK